MCPSSFIAYPSGNTNVAVEIQIGIKRFCFTGKTVNNNGTKFIPMRFENVSERGMRIPLVQEHGQSGFDGQFDMGLERFDLTVFWREVSKKVESGFSNRLNF